MCQFRYRIYCLFAWMICAYNAVELYIHKSHCVIQILLVRSLWAFFSQFCYILLQICHNGAEKNGKRR